MSANYNEQTIAGIKWQRCYQVIANNYLNTIVPGTKSINFNEEEAVTIDGAPRSLGPKTSCTLQYSPAGVIDILDPSTGEPTGETVTHEKIYQMLYSAYIATAKARDLAQ